MKEFGMLVLYMCIGILIFSTLIYFFEMDVNENFASIPDAFWWAIVTMTTVIFPKYYKPNNELMF
jgi:hypothetical protein